MRLAIISHTEHYYSNHDEIVGWGPTVTEINHLSKVFDQIYHVAMLYDSKAPESALHYISDRIEFIPIRPSGGPGLGNKIKNLLEAPHVIRKVAKVLRQVDCFQLRTPTGIGVYLIPYLSLFSSKKGWYKFAGNWNQKNPPLGYAIQRWFLKRQSRKVTINGYWVNQPEHTISFENPCLSNHDISVGEQLARNKEYCSPFSICFVGRLESAKGVRNILEALSLLGPELKFKIKEIHFVGDGPERSEFEKLAESIDLNIFFHGYLNRDSVVEIYKKAHLLLLPSIASEGFPKVIAEAMNYGCIPIVSNVSSIGHYIKHEENGLIIHQVSPEDIKNTLEQCFQLSEVTLQDLGKRDNNLLNKFTFNFYNQRILTEILNGEQYVRKYE